MINTQYGIPNIGVDCQLLNGANDNFRINWLQCEGKKNSLETLVPHSSYTYYPNDLCDNVHIICNVVEQVSVKELPAWLHSTASA